MDSFFDLKYSEIINLTEADVSKCIIKELVAAGLDAVKRPVEPHVVPDSMVYQVDWSMNYDKLAVALDVKDALNKASQNEVQVQHIGSDYNKKKIVPFSHGKKYDVERVPVFSDEQLEKHERELEDYSEAKRRWDNLGQQVINIENRIKDKFKKCKIFNREVNDFAAKFIEYAELAKGDNEIASEFLRKNFSLNCYHEFYLASLDGIDYSPQSMIEEKAFEEYFNDDSSQQDQEL